MADELNQTLQESILTLLAHSDQHGKVVASLITPDLFEGDYRFIAERCVDYWNKYKEAPKSHVDDLLSDILTDSHNRKAQTYRRIIRSMVQYAPLVNANYILTRLRTFIRMQKIKDAILKSADRLSENEELAVSEVEQIWNDLLRVREIQLEPGLRLSDFESVLSNLEVRQREFSTGIDLFDHNFVVPVRGEVMLLIGSSGKGKTWFLINVGKRAFQQRKKVLHITLEISEELVAQRYYQALFSIAKRDSEVESPILEYDELNRVSGWVMESTKPELSFDSPMIREELETRISWMGIRFNNILVKQFPMRSLTPSSYQAYLDSLELTEGFIPDIVLLDYIGITKTDPTNHRISLGRNLEDFRGIATERNHAFVTVHQTNRKGANAKQVGQTHIGEDWSLIPTSDVVINLSCTDLEQRFGLARLFVSKSRSERDKFSILITQSLSTGQFVLDTTPLTAKYFDQLEAFRQEHGEPNDDVDDESGEYDE